MSKKFETTSKSIYFSKSGDDAYHHCDYFFIKSRAVKNQHLKDCGKNLNKFLIGLVFGRKIGNAVLRNKIRRRIKAIFLKQNLTFANFAYILIAKKKISELDFANLESQIIDSILKINYRIKKKYTIV
jgi:ribonuclease P protein component